MCAEMKKRWMWIWGVLLALALPAPALAITGNLQFFENDAGEGNTRALVGPGTFGLDFRYNASSADGLLEVEAGSGRAGIYDFSVLITTTGNVTLDAFDCRATGCLFAPGLLTATSLDVGMSDILGQEGPQRLGLLTISGSDGTVRVQGGPSGNYTPFSFTPHEFAEFVLASVSSGVIPEPGTFVLLGMGLGGLAFLRRRSG